MLLCSKFLELLMNYFSDNLFLEWLYINLIFKFCMVLIFFNLRNPETILICHIVSIYLNFSKMYRFNIPLAAFSLIACFCKSSRMIICIFYNLRLEQKLLTKLTICRDDHGFVSGLCPGGGVYINAKLIETKTVPMMCHDFRLPYFEPQSPILSRP